MNFKDPYTYILLALLLVFVVFIMLSSRRRKRAQAEYNGMLDELRPGTRVKTIGGVIGRIKEIREEAPGFKTVLLETGNDKSPAYMLYEINAIYGVVAEESVMAAQSLKPQEEAKEVTTEENQDFDAREYVGKRNKSQQKSK